MRKQFNYLSHLERSIEAATALLEKGEHSVALALRDLVATYVEHKNLPTAKDTTQLRNEINRLAGKIEAVEKDFGRHKAGHNQKPLMPGIPSLGR